MKSLQPLTQDDVEKMQSMSSNLDDPRILLSKPEIICEEDSHSAPSRTSSTSGYRENCSLLMMPMGSSDENSSPVHLCLTNSSSTIIPIECHETLLTTIHKGNKDIGSQQTIVTYEQEDTLL